MRNLILVLGLALILGGCATNAPQKAWGKPGVSKMDYALDVGVCAGIGRSILVEGCAQLGCPILLARSWREGGLAEVAALAHRGPDDCPAIHR